MNESGIAQWKQANEIYATLLDLSVTDAIAALNDRPGLTDEVKNLVLTLISSGNESSQFFSQEVGKPFVMPNWEKNTLNKGDELDEYQIVSEIGHGGMASVYKAERNDAHQQKPVAIKVFDRQQLTPALLNRFAIEQDILAGLSHPHIVNMHHGGSSQSGAPYIVMDLIESAQDVDDYCQTHKASVKEIVALIASAAEAIAYAHQNLIVHRDIKPSNLLVDENKQIKVVDFGIAKLMDQPDAPHKTTIMALTPSFASPEQINSKPISVTTDVFSLAAVLLSLLIDELPLPQNRLLKSCVDDEVHIWALLKSKIKDRDLRNVLNQALQQDPAKRYKTMDLFGADLNAWIDQKPVKATPDSWHYRVKKFAQRKQALFAAISTLSVMVVLGVILLSWQVEKTRAEAAKANEVKDFMLDVFSVVNPDEALGEKILAKDLLAQAFAEIESKSFEDAATQVELITAMGQAQLQLGLNDVASESFTAALKLNSIALPARIGHIKTLLAATKFEAAADEINSLTQQIQQTNPQFAALSLVKAELNIATSKDFDAASKELETAQALYMSQNQIKGYLSASRMKADIMYLQSKPEEAAQYLEQELHFALQQLTPINTSVLAIKTDLVDVYNDYGDYPKAIKHSNQLIDDITSILGEEHPFLIKAYLSQAGTQRATGEIEAAKENANKALLLSRKVNGEQHESTARAINLIAVLHYVGGEIEAAIEKMQESARIFVNIRGEDHPETWESKTNVTALLNLSGRYEEALDTLSPVYKKQIDVLGAGHKSTIYSQTVLVKLYAAMDRLDEAQLLGEDMLKVALKELGMSHPLTLGGHFSLAQVYQKQGKLDAAIALIHTIISSESWSDKNEQAINAYNALGGLYFENNDIKSAEKYKELSLAVAVDLLTEESPRTWNQMLNNLEFYLAAKNKPKTVDYLKQLQSVMSQNADVNASIKSRFEQLKEQYE